MERAEDFIVLDPDPDNPPSVRRKKGADIPYTRLLLKGDDEFELAMQARRQAAEDKREKTPKPKRKALPKAVEEPVPLPKVKRKNKYATFTFPPLFVQWGKDRLCVLEAAYRYAGAAWRRSSSQSQENCRAVVFVFLLAA